MASSQDQSTTLQSQDVFFGTPLSGDAGFPIRVEKQLGGHLLKERQEELGAVQVLGHA